MVRQGTKLKVADNTGVKELLCIHVLGGSAGRYTSIGDIIATSIKDATPGGIIKKINVVETVVVYTVKGTHRKDGSYIRFDEDAVVIIRNGKTPGETRISEPVVRELKDKQFMEIVSLAPEIL